MLDLIAKLFPKRRSHLKIGERVVFTKDYLENAGFNIAKSGHELTHLRDLQSVDMLEELKDRVERVEHSRFHADMIVVKVLDDLDIVEISYNSIIQGIPSDYKRMTVSTKDLRSLNKRMTYEELCTHPDKTVRTIVLRISSTEYG